jgi:hypothetical protein
MLLFIGSATNCGSAEAMSSLGASGPSQRYYLNGRFRGNAVEKLCFEKSDDFICVLSVISYARY